MGALYIKDDETSRIVTEAAELAGETKRALVKRLAEEELGRLRRQATMSERLNAWRKANPLPPPTGLKADKAFFDWLSGEEDVSDVPETRAK